MSLWWRPDGYLWCEIRHAIHLDSNHIDIYKNIKHICTLVDLRHLCVQDSLLCVLICTYIPINSNGYLGNLIWLVYCDVTVPFWCHLKAVSCLGWDKLIWDTQRLSRTPRCTRQDGLTTVLSLTWDPYIDKTTSLYWDGPPMVIKSCIMTNWCRLSLTGVSYAPWMCYMYFSCSMLGHAVICKSYVLYPDSAIQGKWFMQMMSLSSADGL